MLKQIIQNIKQILVFIHTSADGYLTSVSGTDEDAILMLLTARSNDQRQQIKAAYKKAYGKVS